MGKVERALHVRFCRFPKKLILSAPRLLREPSEVVAPSEEDVKYQLGGPQSSKEIEEAS